MNEIVNILKSKIKPKEKVTRLADEIKRDIKFIKEIINYFETAKAGDQGHLIESLEYTSKEYPELIIPHLEFIIQHLDNDAPRVKWECARIIVNLAPRYCEKLIKSIPNILRNTEDKGTVVRWSSAFALGEIAKYSSKNPKELINKMKHLMENEKNNGVKNVYVKALKALDKG